MIQADLQAEPLSTGQRMLSERPAAKHIPALDGVRGLAILLVLVHHFSGGADPSTALGRGWLSTTSALWVGVDLFFVLSGFLITGILWDSKRSTKYFRNFYARRLLRIFPLYYGILLFVLIAFPFVQSHIRQEGGKEFYSRQIGLWLYLTNFVLAVKGPRYYWAFDHFWSLAVEEHFYFLWPLAIYLCSRAASLRLCGIVALTALVLRVALRAYGVGPTANYVLTPCRMDALAIGGLAAMLIRGPSADIWFKRARPIALASGVAIVAIIICRHGLSQEDPIVQTAGFSLLAIFFAAILLMAVAASPMSLAGRFWTLSPLRFMGKLAYGLYVFHPFFIIPLARLYEGRHRAALGWSHLSGILLFTVAGIVASLITAFLSWHLYEKHFLKLKSFFEYNTRNAPRIPEPQGRISMPEAVASAELDASSGRAGASQCCGMSSSTIARLATVVLLLVALAGAYRIKKHSLDDAIHLASDMRGPFISARAWVRGLNPYDNDIQEEQWRQIRAPGDEDLKAVHFFEWTPSLYPPTTLAAISPLTFAPWPAVRIYLLLQNCVLSGLAYLALCDLLQLPLSNWRAQLLGALWLSLGPYVTCLHLSNPSGPAILTDLLAVWAVARNRQILGGVLLGISTAIKPQIGGALILFYFLRPALKTALIATGITAFATLVGVAKLAINGVHWVADARAALATAARPGGFNDPSRLNPSAWQLVNLQYGLFGLFQNRTIINILALAITLALCAMFALAWRRSQTATAANRRLLIAGQPKPNPLAREALAASIPLLICLLPVYHRYYDCLVLALPLAWGIAMLGTRLNRFAWLAILGTAPFYINWAYLLDDLATKGRVPARIVASKFWQTLIMPCQVWVILTLILILIAALKKIPAQSKTPNA